MPIFVSSLWVNISEFTVFVTGSVQHYIHGSKQGRSISARVIKVNTASVHIWPLGGSNARCWDAQGLPGTLMFAFGRWTTTESGHV